MQVFGQANTSPAAAASVCCCAPRCVCVVGAPTSDRTMFDCFTLPQPAARPPLIFKSSPKPSNLCLHAHAGVWYVGVFVWGDEPAAYTLTLRKGGCPGAPQSSVLLLPLHVIQSYAQLAKLRTTQGTQCADIDR